jgi:hypothetical protein
MAPKSKVVTKRGKKPTKKAAGAETFAAPIPAVVADTEKKPAVPVDPAPVVIVQPVPEPIVQPNPEPVIRMEPIKPAKPKKGLTPEEETIAVEKEIAALQARLWELQHPIIEFPKMVTPKVGPARTFNSREEQDAAGPDYADKD